MHIWRENNLQTAKAAKQFGKGKEKMRIQRKVWKTFGLFLKLHKILGDFPTPAKWPNKSQTSLSWQFLSCQSKCQFDVRIWDAAATLSNTVWQLSKGGVEGAARRKGGWGVSISSSWHPSKLPHGNFTPFGINCCTTHLSNVSAVAPYKCICICVCVFPAHLVPHLPAIYLLLSVSLSSV